MPVGCRLQRPGMRRLLLAPNVERRSKAARSARPQSRLALAESLLAPPAAGPESRASMPETTTARAGKANRIESRCHCDTTHKGPGNQPGLPAGGGRGDAPPNLHREPAPSNMQPVRPRGRQDLLFFLCRFIFFSFCFGFVLWLWRVSLSELEAFLSGFLASYSPRVVYFFFFFLSLLPPMVVHQNQSSATQAGLSSPIARSPCLPSFLQWQNRGAVDSRGHTASQSLSLDAPSS